MESATGKIVRNKITKQQGRVVRLANHDDETCYIVFITRDPAGRAALGPECFWRQDEVETVPSARID